GLPGLLDLQGVTIDANHAAPAVGHPQQAILGRVGHAAGGAAGVGGRPGLGLGVEAPDRGAAHPDHAVGVDGHPVPPVALRGLPGLPGHVGAVDPDQLGVVAQLRAPEVAVAVHRGAIDPVVAAVVVARETVAVG